MKKKYKQIILFCLGIIIIIPFVLFIDKSSWLKFRHINIFFVIGSFLFTILSYYIDSIRWGMITNDIEGKCVCHFKDYFSIFLLSAGLSQFVSQIGGLFIVRPTILKRQFNVDYKISTVAIFTEKVADMFFLIILLLNALGYFFLKLDFYLIVSLLIGSFIIGYVIYSRFGFLLEKIAYFILKILIQLKYINKKKLTVYLLKT